MKKIRGRENDGTGGCENGLTLNSRSNKTSDDEENQYGFYLVSFNLNACLFMEWTKENLAKEYMV